MDRLLAACFALLLVSAGPVIGQPSEARWQPVGLAGGGAMFSVAGSPHDARTMMVSCDMSGAYITRDGGRHWRMLHHRELRGNTRCAPLFHPSKPAVIWAAHGWAGSIRVSEDGGEHWRDFVVGRPPWRGRVRGLWLGLSGDFFVSTEEGLWRGREDGTGWGAASGVRGVYFGMGADRGKPGRYTIGTDRGVFRSTDGGKSFRKVGRGLPARALTGFAGGSNEKETVLYVAVECAVENGELTGGIYASRDGGESWRRVMHPDLNVQTKRSSRWANSDVPSYLFLATTDRAPKRVYVYCSGTSYSPPDHSTVYRSDDAGATWKAVFFSDPRFEGLYNVEDDRITLSIGQRYQPVPFSFAVNPGHPDTLMMTLSMSTFVSQDGGRSWQVSHAGAPERFGDSLAWPCNGLVVTTTWNYYVDPFDAKRHYIAYTDVGLARSEDAGRTWIWEGHRLPWHNTTYELAFDPEVPGKIWGAFSNTHDIPNANVISGRHRVIMSGGVALSLDHGHTWEKLALPEAPCLSVVVDPRSPRSSRTLWASLFEKGVYRSSDGGSSWVRKSEGLGSEGNLRCCKLVRDSEGTLFNLITAKRLASGGYEAEGVGLYRSRDGGDRWEKISGAPGLRWPKDFVVNPRDSDDILLGAANIRGSREGGLYRTRDGGKTWRRIVQKGSEHFGGAFHPRRPGWIYTTLTEGAREAGLYLSRDDGATWEAFTDLPFSNIQRVHFDFVEDGKIILTTFGSSVLVGPEAP